MHYRKEEDNYAVIMYTQESITTRNEENSEANTIHKILGVNSASTTLTEHVELPIFMILFSRFFSLPYFAWLF